MLVYEEKRQQSFSSMGMMHDQHGYFPVAAEFLYWNYCYKLVAIKIYCNAGLHQSVILCENSSLTRD